MKKKVDKTLEKVVGDVIDKGFLDYFKIVLFCFWIIVVLCLFIFYFYSGLSIVEVTQYIQGFIGSFGMYSALAFILIYAVRPLTFFPGSAMTILSGVLFGPWYGVLYVIIGANLSATLSFFVGNYFGHEKYQNLVGKYKMFAFLDKSSKDNGFIIVLLMRLLFFPYDMAGFLSGVFKFRFRDFIVASFIGTLPGIIGLVFLGSSIDDPRFLILAFIFLGVGILISRFFKKKRVLEKRFGQKKLDVVK